MSTAVRATGAVPGGAKRHRAIKVMIVDDSLTVRTIFSRTIESQPDLVVEATANSAEQAIALLEHTILDVILLDLEMPGMGGLAALPTLLEKARHAQIIVVSSLTDEGAKYTLEALAIGAADTLLKPTSGRFDVDYRALLLGKIRALSAGSAEPSAVAAASRSLLPTVRAPSRQTASILEICGSTGGIHALCLMLEKLPASLGVPILVTQHLPASFMSVFARQVGMAASRPAQVAPAGTVRTRYISRPERGT